MAQKAVRATSGATMEPISTARTSFSGDFFFHESNFISINPHSPIKFSMKDPDKELKEKGSSSSDGGDSTAGELLFQGKLLPFWKVLKQSQERNDGIEFGDFEKDDDGKAVKKKERRVSCFVVDDDDNPSPRPTRCTVLWKELLRLKKQRASSMLPSSSSSRSSMKTRKGLFQHK